LFFFETPTILHEYYHRLPSKRVCARAYVVIFICFLILYVTTVLTFLDLFCAYVVLVSSYFLLSSIFCHGWNQLKDHFRSWPGITAIF